MARERFKLLKNMLKILSGANLDWPNQENEEAYHWCFLCTKRELAVG